MRCIQLAIAQLIAHAGPGGFLAEHDFDAIFLIEAELRCHHQRSAVGQRQKTDSDCLLFRLVRARHPGVCAQWSQHKILIYLEKKALGSTNRACLASLKSAQPSKSSTSRMRWAISEIFRFLFI